MKGVIYLLIKDDKVYVGQTKNSCARFSNHKTDYKAWLNNKTHYKSSYEIIKEKDFDIIILEELDDTADFKEREQFYIDKHKNEGYTVVNKYKAKVEKDKKKYAQLYYRENKDKLNQKRIIYYEKNKDIIRQKNKEIYNKKEKTREACKYCEKEMLKTNLIRHHKICIGLNEVIKILSEDEVKAIELGED